MKTRADVIDALKEMTAALSNWKTILEHRQSDYIRPLSTLERDIAYNAMVLLERARKAIRNAQAENVNCKAEGRE